MPEIADIIFAGEDEARRASAQALRGIRTIMDALRQRELDDDGLAANLLRQSADELLLASRIMAGVDLRDQTPELHAAYDGFAALIEQLAAVAQQKAEMGFRTPIIYDLGPLLSAFLFRGAAITAMARQAP